MLTAIPIKQKNNATFLAVSESKKTEKTAITRYKTV